jgi:hypothetical protein
MSLYAHYNFNNNLGCCQIAAPTFRPAKLFLQQSLKIVDKYKIGRYTEHLLNNFGLQIIMNAINAIAAFNARETRSDERVRAERDDERRERS